MKITFISVHQHGFALALKLEGSAKVAQIGDDDIPAVKVALGLAWLDASP